MLIFWQQMAVVTGGTHGSGTKHTKHAKHAIHPHYRSQSLDSAPGSGSPWQHKRLQRLLAGRDWKFDILSPLRVLALRRVTKNNKNNYNNSNYIK